MVVTLIATECVGQVSCVLIKELLCGLKRGLLFSYRKELQALTQAKLSQLRGSNHDSSQRLCAC